MGEDGCGAHPRYTALRVSRGLAWGARARELWQNLCCIGRVDGPSWRVGGPTRAVHDGDGALKSRQVPRVANPWL